MGRPVNKRAFGLLDDGTNITVNCKVGGNAVTAQGYIVRQRSTHKFMVNDLPTGTKTSPNGTGTGNVDVCILTNKANGSLLAGEMSIDGHIAGSPGTQVKIKKMYNRTCRDYNNVRYKWTVVNDSSVSYLQLTAF